jgi:hypothetical protein
MSRDRARGVHASSTTPAEPRLHSHVTDRLPTQHPLAHTRVYCGRCLFRDFGLDAPVVHVGGGA